MLLPLLSADHICRVTVSSESPHVLELSLFSPPCPWVYFQGTCECTQPLQHIQCHVQDKPRNTHPQETLQTCSCSRGSAPAFAVLHTYHVYITDTLHRVGVQCTYMYTHTQDLCRDPCACPLEAHWLSPGAVREATQSDQRWGPQMGSRAGNRGQSQNIPRIRLSSQRLVQWSRGKEIQQWLFC